MKTKTSSLLLAFALCVALLLTLVGITDYYSSEVNWSRTDYVIATMFLFAFTSLVIITLKINLSIRYKVGLIALLIILFLTIWIELAVGLFGSPFSGT